jgi:alanine racemase
VPKDGVQVGTVPIGYADGLSRTLSGRMDVLVDGQRLHQVGRICMDQFMIASDMRPLLSRPAQPELREGDVVTVIGRDGDEEITMDEMAELRGTINYEVACNFGMRLDKINC